MKTQTIFHHKRVSLSQNRKPRESQYKNKENRPKSKRSSTSDNIQVIINNEEDLFTSTKHKILTKPKLSIIEQKSEDFTKTEKGNRVIECYSRINPRDEATTIKIKILETEEKISKEKRRFVSMKKFNTQKDDLDTILDSIKTSWGRMPNLDLSDISSVSKCDIGSVGRFISQTSLDPFNSADIESRFETEDVISEEEDFSREIKKLNNTIYNHPLLPEDKTDDENFKTLLVKTKFKRVEFPTSNSEYCKKRNYLKMGKCLLTYLVSGDNPVDTFANVPTKIRKSSSCKKIYDSLVYFKKDGEVFKTPFKIYKDDDIGMRKSKTKDLLKISVSDFNRK